MEHRIERVLIIEDDLGDSFLLCRSLRKRGICHVESVTSADEARKYVEGLFPFENRWLPDLIFIDLKIHGADGVELISWLKSNSHISETPLIVFSGSHDPTEMEKALNAGATAFFHKTADIEQLNVTMQKAFQSGNLLRARCSDYETPVSKPV